MRTKFWSKLSKLSATWTVYLPPESHFLFSYRIRHVLGTSLVVWWLRLQVSNERGTGSISGRGTKIPQAMCYGQKSIKKLGTS